MTESNEGLYLNTKPLSDKAKKAVIIDATKKVAVTGAAGFATGFMTVLGTMAAQKMFDKLEEHKTKKMLKKTEKEEATVTGELVSNEEVED